MINLYIRLFALNDLFVQADDTLTIIVLGSWVCLEAKKHLDHLQVIVLHSKVQSCSAD